MQIAHKGTTEMNLQIPIDRKRIEEFCRKWKISEFAFFGSILRDDFCPESDVDVLVTFANDSHWSLLDIVDMMDELKGIFGHDVDIVEKDAIRNPYRRRAILAEHEVFYAA